MQNQFGYNCPVNWAKVPEEIQYITINWLDVQDMAVQIKGHKSPPYPYWNIHSIEWKSDEIATNEFSITLEFNMIEKTLKSVTDELTLVFGKCIWQRPKN